MRFRYKTLNLKKKLRAFFVTYPASLFRTLPTNGRFSAFALKPVWFRPQQRFHATMPA